MEWTKKNEMAENGCQNQKLCVCNVNFDVAFSVHTGVHCT